MGDFFGWDLIYKLSENELKKKEDVLTLFTHYILVKGGYKCIGLGDEKALTGNEVSSETLPVEWNNSSTYSIRYVLNNNLFILKGIPVDNNIVYNLLVSPPQGNHEFPYAFNIKQYFVINNTGPDMKVTNVAFHTDSVVAALKGELSTLIPTHEEVLKRIQSDLLAPMGNGTTKEATTQATATESRPVVQSHRPVPSRSGYEFPDPDHPNRPWPPYNPDRDPMLIGRSDLDPLARGGGMIFNPFGRNPPGFPDPSSGLPGPRLPRGAVPPGARFDPFGPVIPNPPLPPRRPPDSDDFHPPGFGAPGNGP